MLFDNCAFEIGRFMLQASFEINEALKLLEILSSNFQNRFSQKQNYVPQNFCPKFISSRARQIITCSIVSTIGDYLNRFVNECSNDCLWEDLITRTLCGGFMAGSLHPAKIKRNLERRREPVANATRLFDACTYDAIYVHVIELVRPSKYKRC